MKSEKIRVKITFQINQINPFPFYFLETDVYDVSDFYVMAFMLGNTVFCNLGITSAIFTKVFKVGVSPPLFLRPNILAISR